MKLTVIGGGGVRSLMLAKSLAQNAKEYNITHIVFMDNNVQKLNIFGALAREVAIRKVNGASLKDLYLLLGRKYLIILSGAFAVALPLSWYLIYEYTKDFVVKAPISIFIYYIAILIVSGISLGTLFWQVNKAARINPAKIMKSE